MTNRMQAGPQPGGGSRLIRNLASCAALAAVALVAAPLADAQANYAALAGSYRASTDLDLGQANLGNMTVELVLAPSNADEITRLLADVYNPKSANYQRWLAKGEFASRFAPSSEAVAAATNYLQASGLTVQASASPFLLRASGNSHVIEAALGTTLRNYLNANGVRYFANDSAVRLPAELAANVLGVVGLSSTVRLHTNLKLPQVHQSVSPPCEAPYPTRKELYAAVNNGTLFPFGYGGGPGCNGLTPSQTNSLYGAPALGASARGRGATFAVFELSWYQRSDIATWAQQFYGASYNPPLTDIVVDGGPLAPICPTGDTCPANFNFYAGDVEVDADIEQTLAIAPRTQHLLVYNAPNDFSGQTELDEYTQIANDNLADVISSSWGICENDVSAGYVQTENLIFEQMALQGQSVFGAAGDTGAFTCIRADGTTIVNQNDPPTQPWVTSVGGTSFESFNPDGDAHPSYPDNVESVWNVDNLCNAAAQEGGQPGFFWCAVTGAGGGGASQWWGRPVYQSGPGVNNAYTTYGNGTTQCAFAAIGHPCREVPDISANADEYTPYAEYCTGSAATPYSVCATIGSNVPGWFGIGGTSLSSPLVSAIVGDRDAFAGSRLGNANPYFYSLLNGDYEGFFHDIRARTSANNNGLYPATRNYDEATGIGTPKMGALITGAPEH